eukprot:555863-Hanusia_phi.AAC.2
MILRPGTGGCGPARRRPRRMSLCATGVPAVRGTYDCAGQWKPLSHGTVSSEVEGKPGLQCHGESQRDGSGTVRLRADLIIGWHPMARMQDRDPTPSRCH